MKSIINTLVSVLTFGSTFALDIPNYGMTKEQIELLREQGKSELEIVQELIKGSTTFTQRTKFSKSKYIINKLDK